MIRNHGQQENRYLPDPHRVKLILVEERLGQVLLDEVIAVLADTERYGSQRTGEELFHTNLEKLTIGQIVQASKYELMADLLMSNEKLYGMLELCEVDNSHTTLPRSTVGGLHGTMCAKVAEYRAIVGEQHKIAWSEDDVPTLSWDDQIDRYAHWITLWCMRIRYLLEYCHEQARRNKIIFSDLSAMQKVFEVYQEILQQASSYAWEGREKINICIDLVMEYLHYLEISVCASDCQRMLSNLYSIVDLLKGMTEEEDF